MIAIVMTLMAACTNTLSAYACRHNSGTGITVCLTPDGVVLASSAAAGARGRLADQPIDDERHDHDRGRDVVGGIIRANWLVRQNRLEDAAVIYDFLWSEIPTAAPRLLAIRNSSIKAEMHDLAERSPTARALFRKAQHKAALTFEKTLDRRSFLDWMFLCEITNDADVIVKWYLTQCDAKTQSLLREWADEYLMALLFRAGLYRDAGTVLVDPGKTVARWSARAREVSEEERARGKDERPGGAGVHADDEARKGFEGGDMVSGRSVATSLRRRCAEVCACLSAAGRDQEAQAALASLESSFGPEGLEEALELTIKIGAVRPMHLESAQRLPVEAREAMTTRLNDALTPR